MARRRVDEMAALNARVPRGYQGYWQVIRGLARRDELFTLRDVEQATNAQKDTVRDYLHRLERAGIVAREGAGEHGATLYRLVQDVGPVAPRLRRDGSEVQQGAGQDHMWRAMKMVGDFSAQDLLLAASTDDVRVTLDTAKTYIRHLFHAGYLARRAGGKGPVAATYRLKPSMNTGPLAPMVQSVKQVWDPNRREVVWREGES